ncbi:unnamed protein product [Rotaria sp. Silwood2]|nr:unnamed protein product [Rotaria sp. Silwood2]CAF4491329.1 unnamed protein product [Rotaria sp. Silwood2]
MPLTFLLLLLININLIILNNTSSFDLILNIDGKDNYFRFVEIITSTKNHLLPSVIILDGNDHNPTTINSSYSSFIQTYHIESDENPFNIATIINRVSSNSNLLYAIIQISNDSLYDVIASISISEIRSKRSCNDDYIVKHNGLILKQAYVSIQWHNNRERRSAKKFQNTMSKNIISSITLPKTIKNRTFSSNKKVIPKKSRHIYLEIIAIIDSLILHDVQILLNRTEFETIEILKLYYIHIFIGVEQIYRQSLIHETFDIHIRLSKIIFSTNKYRLPWESFKNISSLTNIYRKSPNNLHLRPNISMNLLKSLQQAYTSNQFDRRFFTNTVDHIMTFTRLDLIDGAGLAYVSGLCLPLYKYSIIQEDFNSFSVMLTVTHELGHNLGLRHDEIENKCNDPHKRYIMSPKIISTMDRPKVAYFSQCSIKELNYFINNTTTKCWKNKIISIKDDKILEKDRNLISTQLGQIINLRQQCQLQYGLQAIPFISVTYNKSQALYEENICHELKCFKQPTDDFMYWQDGALDGTPCGENRICHQKKCVSTNQKMKRNDLALCPYGDLFVPIRMLNLKDKLMTGNMLCSDALNLLRAHGMNVTYLCYNSILPYQRICCEECKKHLIPECGDLHSRCPTFVQYCQMKFVRIDGRSPTELCPYTCGQCSHLLSPPTTITTTTIRTAIIHTLTKKERKIPLTKVPPRELVKTIILKPRKYIKPKKFTEHTCIDSADCSQLIKLYSKLNKNVKNWCTEYSTMIKGRYFVEMCPKYCSLCNITSVCDRYKLCRNNGKCIKNEYGTYQCICSPLKPFYGALCEYRRTCLNKPCLSKNDICLQTQGENYVCLSKEHKEKIYTVLNSISSIDLKNTRKKT